MAGATKQPKDLSTQATIYFLGRVAATVVTFLVPIVLVRVFTKSEYGHYAQFILLFGFFFRVMQFGIRQSLFYYLPSQPEHRRYFVTNTYLSFLAAGLAFFVILTVFREPLATRMNADDLVMLLPLCGLHTMFMLVASPFESILIIESKAEKASALVFVSEIIRCICVLSFVLVFKSVSGAILGLVCYSFIRFLAYSYIVYGSYGFRLDRNSGKHFHEQLNYAVPIGCSGLMANTSKRIDKLVLLSFFAPEVYAIYAVGAFKIPLIKTFFHSIGEVILPKAVSLLKDGKADRFVELWRALLVRFFFVGCTAFFALQLVAHDLITLVYTDGYEASVPVFRILLFLLLGQMFQYGIILRTIGDTKSIFKSNLLAFVISVPLTIVLVRSFGLTGAAISALAAFFINSLSQLRYSVIGLERKITDIFPVQTLVQLLAMGGTLFAVIWCIQDVIDNKIIRIFVSGATFVIAFTFLCKLTHLFNIFDEKPFKKVLLRLNLARASD